MRQKTRRAIDATLKAKIVLEALREQATVEVLEERLQLRNRAANAATASHRQPARP